MTGRSTALGEMVNIPSLSFSMNHFPIPSVTELISRFFLLTVSHSFGYGLMDAAAMVRLARVWTTVAPQQFCEIRAPDTNK